MPIDTRAVSAAQRDLILALEEGHFGDLKSIDISPAKLTRTLAAFANADGGELYVGIDEDLQTHTRTWRGFARVEDANGHIQPFEALFPLGTDFDYTFLTCPGEAGFVLQVQVRKTSEIKRASDSIVYLRRSASNLPVTSPEALRRLEYVKGLASFETEVVDAPSAVIVNSLPAIEFMLRVVPTAEPEAWLAKQRLLRESRPTVAGVLLFSEEPQALLPKRCGIKIYRYKTKEPIGTRESLAFTPLTVEGHTYVQVRQAVAQATSVVEEIRRLGDEALERIQYPNEAIHEIITNAVLHRDYSVADDIHIRIFDNRIEIEGPGRLPAHITPSNILDERFARNGALVRIVNKFPDPPNQDVGEGLNTAFAAMKKLGLKPPVIEEKTNSVLVTIRHEALASPEQLILEYLEANPTIRNKTARELCNIGADYVVKDIFGRLVERRLIERVPGTDRGSTAYQKGPRFARWRQERPAE
ncbi:MAG: ATP-binding protein [Thermoanaerobaculia bacterium]